MKTVLHSTTFLLTERLAQQAADMHGMIRYPEPLSASLHKAKE